FFSPSSVAHGGPSLMGEPNASRPHPTSAALMVCTYRRPQAFAKLVATIATLDIPKGLAFSIVVADNNRESAWGSYIQAPLASLPWPVHYGHEPEPGYSNARNAAIKVALERTDAEILLFVDDDMLLSQGWLAGHLASHVEFGCDVVNGRISGVRERFPHGAKLQKCGAGNVSFNRRLVAANGLGLRFDPAFNATGMEDQAFFGRAVALGVDIRQSDHPLIYNYYGDGPPPEEEIVNKMLVTGGMQQNLVARARQEKGVVPAAMLASKGLLFGGKALGLAGLSRLQRLLGRPDEARRSELSAQKERLKMSGRFRGFSGRMVSRQEVRRGDTDGA
ncbi:MAG TPA: glycosyltransferase, partial [Hyphomicrobiaceae bacterium]|nr:glycosyltransferase [Hyphomicrobiaceae bacterium]